MQCPSCQAALADGVSRCLSCGASLLRDAPPPAAKRTFSPGLVIFAIAVAVGAFTMAGPRKPTQARTPEEAVLLPMRALRDNDLGRFVAAYVPDSDQALISAKWNELRAQSDPIGDGHFNQQMAMLLAPGAVDSLMATIEPQLAGLDPRALASSLTMLAAMSGTPQASGQITAVSDWIGHAGLERPDHARKALGYAIDSARAIGVKTAADIRALDLDGLVDHASKSLPPLKQALAVYGVDLDRVLDSVAVQRVEGDGERRTVTVAVTAFGRTQSFPAVVENRDGHWFVDKHATAAAATASAPSPSPSPSPSRGGARPPAMSSEEAVDAENRFMRERYGDRDHDPRPHGLSPEQADSDLTRNVLVLLVGSVLTAAFVYYRKKL